MKKVTLRHETKKGEILQATFLPEKGMNLISYSYQFDNKIIEAIDQETLPLFEERSAGLGALIGPHFHNRAIEKLPNIPQLYNRENITSDPFSHGMSRYTAWHYTHTNNEIKGSLTGRDLFQKIPLQEIEGFDFSLQFCGALSDRGLNISYSGQGGGPIVVGLHYYYALKEGLVRGDVQDHYRDQMDLLPIPNSWKQGEKLHFKVEKPLDFTFFPKQEEGKVDLMRNDGSISISYKSQDSNNQSLQIWHPENASFICLEPIGANNPRALTANQSTINALIQISPN